MKPVARHIECEACQNTGRRHAFGHLIVPYQHCRICLGLSSLKPSGGEPERDGEREMVLPVDPDAPGRAGPSPRKRPSFRRPWE